MMISMHAGGVIIIHVFWLMLLVLALGCVLVAAAIGAIVPRR